MDAGKTIIEALKPHYESGNSDIAQDFFVPCLTYCNRYKRAVGFFSSSTLVTWAQILPRLVNNDDVGIQLLMSPQLSPKDKLALQQASTASQRERLLQELADQIVTDAVEFAANPSDVGLRMRLFSWLVASGRLEVAFAFPEHVDDAGIFHEKIGVFEFPWDATVAFTGSANESLSGHSRNYESIDVFRDWIPNDCGRVRIKTEQYETAWRGAAPGLKVLTLSSKALEKVKQAAPDDRPDLGAYRVNIDVAKGVRPRAYQQEAIDAWIAQGKRGILDMATGTGKTKTALFAVKHVREDFRQLLIVVVAPYKHLAEQWADECDAFGWRKQMCSSDYPDWEQKAANLRLEFAARSLDLAFLIVTYATFAMPRFQSMLSRFSQPKMFIADEVHHLGAESRRRSLNAFDARLGLSATPRRTYDPEGTQWLLDNVGPIVYRFPLQDAIPEFLTPYDYHLHLVRLTSEEQEEYADVMEQIALVCARGADLSEEDPDANQHLGALLRRRHEVIGGASNKLPCLNQLLRARIAREGVDSVNFSLFYSSSRLFDQVMTSLSKVHDLRVSKFTFEETRHERQDILQGFADGRIHAILAKKCLDEGMDIPATRAAFILASSSNPMEFIQRRGRVLRRFPGKDRAVIHDFFVLPAEHTEINQYDQRLVERELKRILEFADTSRNPVPTREAVMPIQKQYSLLHL